MYHINPKTGEAGLCKAKTKCPFGGVEEHFTSAEAARADYEDRQTKRMEVERVVGKELEEYGEKSSVWLPWSKIHNDFKTTREDGSRHVLANAGAKGTVLTPWRGPKMLEIAKTQRPSKKYDESWEKVIAEDSSYRATTEKLSAVIARQNIVTDGLQKMLDEHGPDVEVDVLSRHTPFGTYLSGVVKSED